MTTCRRCDQAYPDELAACPLCGHQHDIGHPELPLRGDETREELVERFFGAPVIYRRPPFETGLQLALPWSLPLLAAAMEAPRWLTGLLTLLATLLVVSATVAARRRVIISRAGLRAGARWIAWPEVASVRLVPGAKPHNEPARLIVRSSAGEIEIPRETTRGSGISSLRNLARILEQILASEPAE